MIAVFVNMATVLAGSLIGIFFSSRLRESLQHALLFALGLRQIVSSVGNATQIRYQRHHYRHRQ